MVKTAAKKTPSTQLSGQSALMYFWCYLPLPRCRIFYLSPFYLCFSSREKHQKRPSHSKIMHASLLLRRRKRHPSVGCHLSLKAVRCRSGARGLVRFSVKKKNNATALQTSLRFFPEPQRPSTVILTVTVFLGITLVCVKTIAEGCIKNTAKEYMITMQGLKIVYK